MKKNYFVPATESLDIHGEYLMGEDPQSIAAGGESSSGEVDAPIRMGNRDLYE